MSSPPQNDLQGICTMHLQGLRGEATKSKATRLFIVVKHTNNYTLNIFLASKEAFTSCKHATVYSRGQCACKCLKPTTIKSVHQVSNALKQWIFLKQHELLKNFKNQRQLFTYDASATLILSTCPDWARWEKKDMSSKHNTVDMLYQSNQFYRTKSTIQFRSKKNE